MSATETAAHAIPIEVALKICAQIREENRRNPFSFAAMQCWGCVMFSKGEPDRMCLGSSPDNRGCSLVSQRYDEEVRNPGLV